MYEAEQQIRKILKKVSIREKLKDEFEDKAKDRDNAA